MFWKLIDWSDWNIDEIDKLPPRMYQGVQFLFFPIPIFSYFETKTSYFFYFLAGEAKICNKIENGIIVVCVFEWNLS